MTIGKAAVIVAVAASVFGTPLWAQKRLEEIVARVNNQIILKSELDKELRQLSDEVKKEAASPDEAKKLYDEMSKDVLRNLIDVSLLNQVAKEHDIDCQGPVAKRFDDIRRKQGLKDMEEFEKFVRDQGLTLEEVRDGMCRDYLTQEVINREVAGRVVITNEEMRKFHEEHKDEFKREEGIELGEIAILLKKDGSTATAEEQKKKAEEVHQAVKEGKDFADYAMRFSDSPSAQKGGDVEYIFKEDFGNLAQDLLDAIAKLEKGQVSDIIVRAEGFIILKILDKHTGGVLSFELAQNEIYSAIIAKRLPGRVREYLDKQRAEGFVAVSEGYVDTGAVKKSAKSTPSGSKKN